VTGGRTLSGPPTRLRLLHRQATSFCFQPSSNDKSRDSFRECPCDRLLGGIGHTLPYLIANLKLANIIAAIVVLIELLAILVQRGPASV
jgi:hypothetical protein